MGVLSFLGKILSSLPLIYKIVKTLYDAYKKHEDNKVIKRYQQKQETIDRLRKELETADTKEKRSEIASKLDIILNSN